MNRMGETEPSIYLPMNKKQIAAVILVLLASVALTWLVLRNANPPVNRGGEAATEAAKGPHGGRLLSEGDFATEVTIFERGVPPEFRVFFYEKNRLIDPAEVKLRIELHRFGGRVDKIGFSKREDYLLGDQEIVEPHSFDVKVIAERRGKTYRWEYDSYEGRTTLDVRGREEFRHRHRNSGAGQNKDVHQGQWPHPPQ